MQDNLPSANTVPASISEIATITEVGSNRFVNPFLPLDIAKRALDTIDLQQFEGVQIVTGVVGQNRASYATGKVSKGEGTLWPIVECDYLINDPTQNNDVVWLSPPRKIELDGRSLWFKPSDPMKREEPNWRSDDELAAFYRYRHRTEVCTLQEYTDELGDAREFFPTDMSQQAAIQPYAHRLALAFAFMAYVAPKNTTCETVVKRQGIVPRVLYAGLKDDFDELFRTCATLMACLKNDNVVSEDHARNVMLPAVESCTLKLVLDNRDKLSMLHQITMDKKSLDLARETLSSFEKK